MLLFGLCHAADAQAVFVASPPQGSDSNDCRSSDTPCASFQRAAALCPLAQPCRIDAAAGTYSQKLNIVHFHHVSLLGAGWDGQTCVDRRAVTIDDDALEPGSDALFFAEDHATLMVACVTLTSRRGHIGFATRQFAIGDLIDVDFAGFVDAAGAAAWETSKINIANPGILGSAGLFAYARDLSQIEIGGVVKIADGLKFTIALLTSVNGSVVSFQPSSIEGGAQFSGASYQCVGASIEKTVTLPGGDVAYDEPDCRVNGVNVKLAAVQTNIAALRTALDEQTARIEPLIREIAAVRAALDDAQHDQNVQRRKDRVAAIIFAVLILALGGAAYSRTRRKF